MDIRDRTELGDSGFEPERDGASVGELVKEITEDISTLVRKEVELAKGEIAEIVRSKLVGMGLFLVTGVIALFILPFALLTVVEVLAIWLPRWAASSIVTVLMIGLGVLAFLVARKQFKTKLLPNETIETIKEDMRWAKSLKK